MARVVLDDVSKVFQGPNDEEIRALDRIQLTIENNELLVLLGPSGSGKSTLLRLIAGLEELTHGTISIDGQVINALKPHDRDVAMVFQNHALYPHMTVFDNLAFGLKLRKFGKAEIEQRVAEVADMLGLTGCLYRKPKALSGGECQRVALGRAWVRQPKVFLFDEPLSNLDAPMRAQLRGEIRRLHQRLEAASIYVTHDQGEATAMADRIAVIHRGEIQQWADPLHLYRDPANLFVAKFIGSPPMNLFPGRLERRNTGWVFVEKAETGDASGFALTIASESVPSSAVSRTVILGLRPEEITPIAAGADASAAASAVPATLQRVEITGPDALWHLSTGQHEFVARARAEERAAIGHKVWAMVAMDGVRWFDPGTGLALS